MLDVGEILLFAGPYTIGFFIRHRPAPGSRVRSVSWSVAKWFLCVNGASALMSPVTALALSQSDWRAILCVAALALEQGLVTEDLARIRYLLSRPDPDPRRDAR